jgi:copper chaperone CopZ
MTSFIVPDMTCGHCVATITRALQAADPAAQVRIDLPGHRVQVDQATLPPPALQAVITEAGYTPQPAA